RRDFAEQRVMSIPFRHLAEPMRVALTRERGTAGHHEAAANQRLRRDPHIHSRGLEPFDMRTPDNRRRSIVHRAAVALFESRADGCKQCAAVPAIPEQAWSNDGACIVRKVGPPVIVDVALLLPM